MEDIIITSWSDLCDKLYVDSWNDEISRYRTDYAYRGVSDKNNRLNNSFARNCGELVHLEYHLLKNFRKYAQVRDTSLISSDWRVMTIGQHYGLPTRLLDWTYSPFIAAHYSTCNVDEYDKDGAIWLVDFVKVNHMLPEPFNKVLEAEKSNAFTIELIESAVKSVQDFDKMADRDLLLFFEPPSLDDRIVNQYAFFSVMSNPISTVDGWLAKHPELYKRIIIPAELKWEIRDKLDQANITERILLPGLDGLAKWLARHYIPKK